LSLFCVPSPASLSLFCFFGYFARRYLHSFPTRRSSDLDLVLPFDRVTGLLQRLGVELGHDLVRVVLLRTDDERPAPGGGGSRGRSEEHTSELQSRFDLVCRLLLEKKKQTERNVGQKKAI